MKKIIIIIACIFITINLYSQSYFNRLYSLEYPDFGAIFSIVATKDGGYCFPYDIVNNSVDSSFIHIIKTNNKGDTTWAKKYGEPKKKYYYSSTKIYLLPNDDMMIVGKSYKPDTLLDRKTFGFALKIDKEGNQKWLKEFNNGYNECAFDNMVICSDSDYLFSGYCQQYNQITKKYEYSDAYFVKTDTNGKLVWQKVVGNKFFSENITHGIETPNKEFIFVGNYYNSADGYNYMILKLNKDGQLMFFNTFGGEQNESYAQILQRGNNKYLILGVSRTRWSNLITQSKSILTQIDSSGTIIWEKNYGEETSYFTYYKVLEMKDGSFVAAGAQNLKPYFCGLTKFDKDGNIKWHRNYKHQKNLSQDIWDAAITQDKGFILAGTAFQDTLAKGSQGWLLKLDSLGCDKKGCATSTATEETVKEVFFSVYPNPSSDNITIQLGEENTENTSVKIINTYGTVLYKNKITTNEKMIHIDVSSYAAGTYFVMVENERVKGVKKVVVLK